jgi:hypothetical protein
LRYLGYEPIHRNPNTPGLLPLKTVERLELMEFQHRSGLPKDPQPGLALLFAEEVLLALLLPPFQVIGTPADEALPMHLAFRIRADVRESWRADIRRAMAFCACLHLSFLSRIW